jgi:hypothetical protein
MTANAKPAFDIPGIQIVRMNPDDLTRFQGLLDGFQQNVPQSVKPKA